MTNLYFLLELVVGYKSLTCLEPTDFSKSDSGMTSQRLKELE